jgi:hypothetical protein
VVRPRDTIGPQVLSDLAILLGDVVPHAAAPERTFSTMGWMKDKGRNRLSVMKASMLMSIKDCGNTAAICRFELLQFLHVRPRERPFIHHHAVFESTANSIMVIVVLAGRVGWEQLPSESPRKLARAPLSSNTALRLPPLFLLQQWVLLASRTCLQATAAVRRG